MDDQQGNVIDGTARARQWRLAKSAARADSDGAEARSDAPKSIAGSLLVPADMLSTGVSGGDADGRMERGVTELPAAFEVGEEASLNTAAHENPFLAPQAGSSAPGRAEGRGRRWSIAVLFTRTGGLGPRQGGMSARPRVRPRFAQEHSRAWRGAGMIGGAVALAAVAVLLIERGGGVGHPTAQPDKARVIATASGHAASRDVATKLKVATVIRRERQASERRTARRAAERHRQARHETRRHRSSPSGHRPAASSNGAPAAEVEASAASTASSNRSNIATTASTASPSGSSSPTAETARAITTAPVSAATISTPPPPGPSGPGGTVGSNCNPKCS